ncbi:MAG: tyrosine-type recombinase/integrase [Anaerolineae bacterium]|nr:tyrosine-type recombinase/integrase [Anaerolineae bacterium]MCX8067367.1 tyrosine-type recombinase/integrase [Anaerolineae bacterium]MDW7990574.1 tyrosine-type recombinase/integrase [Anaerolineae bacterium]
MTDVTLRDALQKFLDEIAASRSPNTHKAYRQAAARFAEVLSAHGISPALTPVSDLSVEWMGWYIQDLHNASVATEQLYITALRAFYEYAAAQEWASVNLPALHRLCRRRARREAARLPPFPRAEIEKILETVAQAAAAPPQDERKLLRILRDRALLYVLADTGLRVSEACSLTRGHMDWTEARARVLGKGGRESIVRFSERSLRYLRAYLDARAELDGRQGRPLTSLPLFARHDRRAGKRVLPLSARSAEKVVEEWVVRALGERARGTITPHTFRHYFVTVVLRGSGGNVRLAQELARHRSITTTQRYTHLSDDELDRGYHEIFNEM